VIDNVVSHRAKLFHNSRVLQSYLAQASRIYVVPDVFGEQCENALFFATHAATSVLRAGDAARRGRGMPKILERGSDCAIVFMLSLSCMTLPP
jgi:hypothetical protein